MQVDERRRKNQSPAIDVYAILRNRERRDCHNAVKQHHIADGVDAGQRVDDPSVVEYGVQEPLPVHVHAAPL